MHGSLRKYWTIIALGISLVPLPLHAKVLSIPEAISLFLTNSFDIKIENIKQQEVQYKTQEFLGVYDFIWNAAVSYTETPNTDLLAAENLNFFNNTKTLNWETGLSKRFPFGIAFALKWKPSHLTLDLNNIIPAFPSNLQGFEQKAVLTTKVPLLYNFWGRVEKLQLDQLRQNERVVKMETLIAIEDIFKEGINLYKDWYVAHQSVASRKLSLKRAKAVLAIDQQKFRDGLIEIGELAQSKVGVSSRQIDLTSANNTLNLANHTFAAFLNLPRSQMDIYETPDFSSDIKPYSAEPTDQFLAINLAVQRERANLHLAHLAYQEALWGRKAELNFLGEVGVGDAGRTFSQSLDELFERPNPNFSVGIELTVPLGNTTKWAKYQQALLNHSKAEIELLKTKKVTLETYHALLSTLTSLLEQTRNNQQLLELQQTKLDHEEKRFNQGRSSIDLVLRFQDELTQFELQRTELVAEFIKTWITIQLMDTRLFRNYGVPMPSQGN